MQASAHPSIFQSSRRWSKPPSIASAQVHGHSDGKATSPISISIAVLRPLAEAAGASITQDAGALHAAGASSRIEARISS